MLRGLVVVVALLLLGGMVSSDTNLTTIVFSDGRVNFDSALVSNDSITERVNLVGGGSKTVYIDGVKLNSHSVARSVSLDVSSYAFQFLYDNSRFVGGESRELAYYIDRYLRSEYVSRSDHENFMDYVVGNLQAWSYQTELNRIEVQAVSNTLDEIAPEAFCRGKLKVLWDENISWTGADCQGTFFYLRNGSFKVVSTPVLVNASSDGYSTVLRWRYNVGLEQAYGLYPLDPHVFFRIWRNETHVVDLHDWMAHTYTDYHFGGNYTYRIQAIIDDIRIEEDGV